MAQDFAHINIQDVVLLHLSPAVTECLAQILSSLSLTNMFEQQAKHT